VRELDKILILRSFYELELSSIGQFPDTMKMASKSRKETH